MFEVLQPFEVADSHTSSIAKHVRKESNTLGQADLFSLDGGRSIGGFNNQLAFESISIVSIDRHL